ncbi:MAG: hypothetical protein J5733_07115, partial [Bacteroidaceae bacterium]|nr:hypothetical protein [Bacteroidaceae bacterium]
MKHSSFLVALIALFSVMTSCRQHPTEPQALSLQVVNSTVEALHQQYPETPYSDIIERGVRQAAALWQTDDGTEDEFKTFAMENFAATEEERTALFLSLSRIMENLNKSADMLTVELLKPTQLTNVGEPTAADWIMSGYGAGAHFSEDLFANKLAFVTILNFPFYTLEEKNMLGASWSRIEWAQARLGDVFTQRIPAAVNALLSQKYADAENYIADYNICMDRLRTCDGRQLFPDGMLLLSHWNLRDELKADYSDPLVTDSFGRLVNEKQEMIYDVMQRIVRQEIPAAVINNNEPLWYPESNRVEGVAAEREADIRYQRILDVFHAMQQADR